MRLLDKEQAQCLINAIKERQRGGVILCKDASEADKIINYVMGHVEKSIKQCTEKKFPYFNFGKDTGSIEINGSIHKKNHISLGMSFKGVKECVACLDLNHDEFKQFTQDCIAITQWLEENES